MERLRLLREEKGLTQDNIALHLNTGRNTISRYENGEREPDYDTVKKLADYFDTTVDYLLGRTDDPAPLGDKKDPAQPEIKLDEVEFALFGEVRELDEEDKAELLRNAQRMRELKELRKKKTKNEY